MYLHKFANVFEFAHVFEVAHAFAINLTMNLSLRILSALEFHSKESSIFITKSILGRVRKYIV